MKIGICGASLLDVELDKSLEYVGVDRGIESLLNQGIIPVIGIGDFDSIKNIDNLNKLEIKQLPTEKDITDTQAALEYVIGKGYDEIKLYGVTGGRLDHFMAIICLLEKYQDIDIEVIDKQNIIKLLKPGTNVISKSDHKYFSVFALSDCDITLKGCLYPLDNYLLKRDDPLCVSNQIEEEQAIINNNKNIILIVSKDN